jgi:hypothetical protein
MSGKSPVHEIRPGEGYDIESDDYDTDEERDNVPEDELDDILEEGGWVSPIMWKSCEM